MNRRWLIGLSLVAHAGLGIGLFVTGVWRIERLDSDHRAALSLGVMMPPPPPEGGPAAAEAPKVKPKEPPKRIARNTQPVPKRTETPPEVATAASLGTGEGSGEGPGTGDGPGEIGGVPCADGSACIGQITGPQPTCGDGIVEGGESCDDGNRASGDGCSTTCATEPKKTVILAPSQLQILRLEGDPQIHPSDPIKTAMMRDGAQRTTGVLKLCIGTAGTVATVNVVKSTGYASYDERLVAGARSWRYRPYLLEGRPVPACGMVTFIYSIK